MATQLLTAQQVQDLLDVDASTVYRMAGDGRLPAVRIGRQWRFPEEAIEELLTPRIAGSNRAWENAASATEPTISSPYQPGSEVVPAGLATAVLEAVAHGLGVTMVVTDLDGRPISEVVNPAPAISRRLDDPDFLAACTADWREFGSEAHLAPRWQPDRHGLLCAHSLVRSGPSLVAMVMAGGVAPGAPADLGAPGDLNDFDDPQAFILDADRRQVVLDTLPRIAALLSLLVVAEKPA
ncbi:MAG: helix-turn-helix domain-containing protein [Nitriliruptoraceae bacterium]